jgi:hypothetical protein
MLYAVWSFLKWNKLPAMDNDNGVRMRCGIIKSEIEKIKDWVLSQRYK